MRKYLVRRRRVAHVRAARTHGANGRGSGRAATTAPGGRTQEANGLWDNKAEEELRTTTRKHIVDAFSRAEKRLKPPLRELFTDVYDAPSPLLREQEQAMLAHIAKYPGQYPVDHHAAAVVETSHTRPKNYL